MDVLTNMSSQEKIVRAAALLRLSKIFQIPVDQLSQDMEFGKDLRASKRSDFKRNEFDLLDDDIKDVADKRTKQDMAKGHQEIKTVRDYCDHMVNCYSTNHKEVARLLSLETL